MREVVETYEELVNLIPVGRENAINRWALRDKAGVSDRQCRKLIQEAKEHGEVIVNLQDGRGYFKPAAEDIANISKQYHQNLSRMISLSKQQKVLRKILKDAGLNPA